MDYWSRGLRPMLERTRSFMIHFFPLFCVTSHKSKIDICLRHVCRLFLSTVVHLHILRKCFPVSRWNRFQSWTESRNFFITHRFPSFLPPRIVVLSRAFDPFLSPLFPSSLSAQKHRIVMNSYVRMWAAWNEFGRTRVFPVSIVPFFPVELSFPNFARVLRLKKCLHLG